MDKATRYSAPAKLILCGEHAVVYRRPAIALPLASVRATATITPGHRGSGIVIEAPDLGRTWTLASRPDDPLSGLVRSLLAHIGAAEPDIALRLASQIPIASGMGSGAAIATALVRAISSYLGHPLEPATIASLVYASEQRYHGTPSGIDNTVVAYEQAIWFVRGQSTPHAPAPAPLIERLTISRPFTLIVGDTGIRSATRLPVGEVRRRWQANPTSYEAIFDQVAEVSTMVRACLANGTIEPLGSLLNHNQALLEALGVSSPELERLIAAARSAGALGAKLSGAGWGGVMVALVNAERHEAVARALSAAGAVRVLETRVG